MADPLRHVLHAEEGDFDALRERFREDNLQRVRRMTRPHELVLRSADGSERARIATGLRTDAPAGRDERRVDEFLAQGGILLGGVSDEFRVVEGPGLDRELRDLERDARLMEAHERVEYVGEREDCSDDDESGGESRSQPEDARDQRTEASGGNARTAREHATADLASGEDYIRELAERSRRADERGGVAEGRESCPVARIAYDIEQLRTADSSSSKR